MRRFLLACEADSRGRTGLEETDYPQRELLVAAHKAASSLDIGDLLTAHDDKLKKQGAIKALIHQRRSELIRERLGKSK